MFVMGIFYPLDNVRTRLQVQRKDKSQTVLQSSKQFHGMLDCFQKLIRDDWRQLYTGAKSALVGVGFSSSVYYYLYAYCLLSRAWAASRPI
jgi:hypothetical protein